MPVEETNGTSETHEEAEVERDGTLFTLATGLKRVSPLFTAQAGAVEASSRGSPSSVAKSP